MIIAKEMAFSQGIKKPAEAGKVRINGELRASGNGREKSQGVALA